MRKLTYLAVLENNAGKGYGVFFPDVPGCVSYGDDFDQAVKKGKEALELHIYGMEKDREPVPEKTNAVPDLAKGDMVVPISVYPDLVKEALDNRREKTTITLPHWLKVLAEQEGVNYSKLLEHAIKDNLGITV
jgi:predicted RNase H-like HicB family nuclease